MIRGRCFLFFIGWTDRFHFGVFPLGFFWIGLFLFVLDIFVFLIQLLLFFSVLHPLLPGFGDAFFAIPAGWPRDRADRDDGEQKHKTIHHTQGETHDVPVVFVIGISAVVERT